MGIDAIGSSSYWDYDDLKESETSRTSAWSSWTVPSHFQISTDIIRRVEVLRAEVFELREKARPTLEPIALLKPYLAEMGTYSLPQKRLTLIATKGVSGSYFYTDEKGQKRLVVKPLDEDIGAFNNPKGFGSIEGPLLLAPFREQAVYSLAIAIGVDQIAPKTALAIFQSDAFFDVADTCPELGPADKEKLCSVQEFVPDSISLFEAVNEMMEAGLSDAEIAARFDQDDYELTNILLWATGERDGHMGNIVVYPKGDRLGLKKIDNGLALPEKREGFFNSLMFLPNADSPLSENGRAKIQAIDSDAIADILAKSGLSDSIWAMRERIATLKELSLKPAITIHEINTQFCTQVRYYERSL